MLNVSLIYFFKKDMLVKKPTHEALAKHLNISAPAVRKYKPKKKLLLQLGYWKYLQLQNEAECKKSLKCPFTAIYFILQQNISDTDAASKMLLETNHTSICKKLQSIFAGDIDKLSRHLGIDKECLKQYRSKRQLELMILGIQKSNELKFQKLCLRANEKKYKKLVLRMLHC